MEYNLISKQYEDIKRKQGNKCTNRIDLDYLHKIKKDNVPRTSKPRIGHEHKTGKDRVDYS